MTQTLENTGPAIAYVRFSTPKQEHGDSRDRQTRDLTAFAERNGLTIVEWVEDLGRSAYKGDHLRGGNLGILTQRIMAGEIAAGTTLIVEQLDRLSREGHRKAQRWMEDVCEKGLRIGVAQGNKFYDDESLQGNMLDAIEILMKGKLAHDESLSKSKRVGDAWAEKLKATSDGVVLTRGCPGWLVPTEKGMGKDGTSFNVIEDRADAIRTIYRMSADGTGIGTITKQLTSLGIRAWGRSGNGWTPTHLRRLIEGSAPEGDFIPYEANRKKPNGERVVGYYPRIVDADLVDRARAGLKNRKQTGGRHRNLYSNLFQGLVMCRECNGKMTMGAPAVRTDRTRLGPGYFRCMNASLGRNCTNTAFFRYSEFESQALEHMLDLALDDRFFQRPAEANLANADVANAKKAIADLTERQNNLMTMIERGPKDPTALLNRYDELGAEILLAQKALQSADNALVLARGATSAGEHLARVVSVYDALQSDDDLTRVTARQKVSEALRGVVEMVVCDRADVFNNQPPQKTITLVMLGGAHAFKFNNKGDLLAEAGVLKDIRTGIGRDAMIEGVLSTASTRTAQSLPALAQRVKKRPK